MTYDTNNPLGSVDVRDLYDNAHNADKFVNGPLDAYPDRFGVSRQSLQGIRNASQYQVIGAYAAGLQFTSLNQVFSYLGEFYAPGPSIVLPYTTTGVGAAEVANFRSVGDAVLRQDLEDSANPVKGAALIGYKGDTVYDALSSVRNRTLYALDPSYGFVDSVSVDNTAAAVALFDAVQDGDTVDFCGVMWRIYSGVAGLVSATSDPATDQAVPVTSVPRLVNKKNVTIRNGGLYAANQGVSPDKRYYPSTLYLKGCSNIVFAENAQFESRGEHFGDADASAPLAVNDRQDFLAVNGGHAVVMVRCSGVFGSLTARLCGSTAVIYSASSYNVRLHNTFANPASLGYAGYTADAWCGTPAESGLPSHSLYLDDCYSFREALTRREDAADVGSAVYSSKNGVLIEDPSVYCHVNGGYYADCYGNSSPDGFQQGGAFQTGSAVLDVTGAKVSNCAYAGVTAVSSANPGIIRMHGVFGDVGAAVLYAYKASFSYQSAEIFDCSIHVTDTRFLGDVTESAYVINNVLDTALNVSINNCKFTGAKQLFWKPNGATVLSYGGVTVNGGEYETIGYLCNVAGWGGSSAGTRNGITITGNARVYDTSNLTDTYIIAGNSSAGGAKLCYIWFDLRNCEIQTKNVRNIAGFVTSGPANLHERLWYPEILEASYSTAFQEYAAQQSVTFIALNGLAGPHQRIIVRCNGRFPLSLPCAIVGTGGKFVGLQSEVVPAYLNVGTGELYHEVYCDGTPAGGILVANSTYPVFG